ncbi:MAG: MBL fold metallo-hydrolase [Chloroflexi bacterium]|nr:MBL fold metallo-hydrolase [Chloroflexota bacterium]
MEIMPGLHRISLGKAGQAVNAYLSLDPEPLLVDTGMPGHASRIVSYMESQGLAPEALRHIVLTHHDVDHIGSAPELRRLTGARVYAHRLDAPCIAGTEPRRPWLKRLTSGVLGRVDLAVDELLEGGETLAGWQVLHTPGHSLGSISLYRPPVLLVGDLLLSDHGRCREMWRFTMQDAALARETIRRLAGLDAQVLLTGHGEPLRGPRLLGGLIASWEA